MLWGQEVREAVISEGLDVRLNRKCTGSGLERYRSVTMRACSETGLMWTVYKTGSEVEKQAKFSEEFGIREPLAIFKKGWVMIKSLSKTKTCSVEEELMEGKIGL